MTASPVRFPLASASHSRKRRSLLRYRNQSGPPSSDLQDKSMTMDVASAFGTMMLKSASTEHPTSASMTAQTSLSSASMETCISSSSSSNNEELEAEPKIVFRSTVWLDGNSSDEDETETEDDQDTNESRWTLKRASPVCENDEDFFESPTKRSKTTSTTTTTLMNLEWCNRLSESEDVPTLLHIDEE